MTSRTTDRFRRALAKLPPNVQQRAQDAYRQFRDDPHHPSLSFRRVQGVEDVYSVRVGLRYRALCIREQDVLIWFWIGSHADYDGLIRRL